jgi:hypothetical protein
MGRTIRQENRGRMSDTGTGAVDPSAVLKQALARQRLVDRVRDPKGWHRFFTPHATASPAGVLVIAILVAWVRPHEWVLFLLLLAEMLAIALNLMSTTKRLEAVTLLLDRAGVLERFVAEGSTSTK